MRCVRRLRDNPERIPQSWPLIYVLIHPSACERIQSSRYMEKHSPRNADAVEVAED